MSIHRFAVGVVLTASLFAANIANLRAADKANNARQEKHDRYQLPAGGVKELLAFMKEIQAFRPKTSTELSEHRSKGQPALKAATEKIQKIATDDDKKLEGYSDAIAMGLILRAMDERTTAIADQKKLVDDIKAYLTENAKPSQYALAAAQQVALSLEDGGRPDAAVDACRDFAEALSKSKDEKALQTGARLAGIARRLTLLGNPLEIQGTRLDGRKFDWAKYRGKVVLVDFWATWCGPCREELPNVKKNYALYHNRGFEVVGISLDEDRDELEKYVAKAPNPWITLHDGGWDENANATYYGVMGVPTVILVDKEGKVVSTAARGPELGKQLEKLLGPPKPAEKANEPAAKK